MNAISFVKGLAKAQSNLDSNKKERTQLKSNLNKVRDLASQPGVKKTLRQELENLEDNILKVAQMEQQILNKEDMDVKDLKFQIRDLKTKLSLTGAQGLKPSLDKIAFLMGELTSRVETYTNINTNREKRIEELEQKIKEKMDLNFKELRKIETVLERLETQYESIKKSGQADQETLRKTEEKIAGLREQVIEKKKAIIEKKKQELMAVKPHLPAAPGTEPIFKEHLPREQSIKHKMMFPQMPSAPKQKDFNLIPPPEQKKKSFFGWVKGLFGR